jgi:deoxyadenosine/deoxycytidine kinase
MFIVEGNIGAGKSTFLSLIRAKCPSFTVMQEPLHNWASERYGQSLLEEFYKNPDRWAFTIETFAMMARSLDHVKYQTWSERPTVMERSIYSGHYCFAQNGMQEGYFNEIEWAVYAQWVEFILHQQCKPPRGFIYLRATPEICHKRMNKRARSGEELVSLKYLTNIHDRHDKFLISKEILDAHLHHVPVLVLDVSNDFESNPALFEQHLEKTVAFIEQHHRPVTPG